MQRKKSANFVIEESSVDYRVLISLDWTLKGSHNL